MSTKSILTRLLLAAIMVLLSNGSPHQVSTQITSISNRGLNPIGQPVSLETYGQMPLSFEANQGQVDRHYNFISRGPGNLLLLASDEVVLVAQKSSGSLEMLKSTLLKDQAKHNQETEPPTTVRMQLVGANLDAIGIGLEPLPGKVNYYIGNDSALWRTNVPTYARVSYPDVYPGVDLTYYGNQRQLEYDFVVAPGVDPNVIQVAFQDVDKLKLNAQGDLLFRAQGGGEPMRMIKPFVYQEITGLRQEVACSYAIVGAKEVSFRVGAYDASLPLVIDPVLAYSKTLESYDDFGIGIAVDEYGNAYITGLTSGNDFPVEGSYQSTYGGGVYDAYVMKLDSLGNIVYATYLGGSGDENDATLIAGGIAVDAAGNAYVTGSTSSTDFPTKDAFQSGNNGSFDAFVAKLNATGSLNYSTYLGGTGKDDGVRIAVDSGGNAYVTGHTNSLDFYITTGALQPILGGIPAYCQPNVFNFCGDAFVAKLNPDGSDLVYSTYLGGNNDDAGISIVVDSVGYAYVTGGTFSDTGFPIASPPGYLPYQATYGGYGDLPSIGNFGDAFVAKLNPDGSALVYSTYMGGSSGDIGVTIAVDDSGNAYLTGATGSAAFPNASPLYPYHGNVDAFVAKLNPTGSALDYFTYLGGDDMDLGIAIAVGPDGSAYITGGTLSDDFPVVNPIQDNPRGIIDAFVTKLNATGSTLVYSTYFNGNDDYMGGNDYYAGIGITVDAAGNAYVTGMSTLLGNYFGTFIIKLVLATETEVGTDIEVQPVDVSTGTSPVELTFSSVTEAGTTSLSISSDVPTPPAGFSLGETPTYYEISTTANYIDTVIICIAYDPDKYSDPTNLQLLHYQDGVWVDVTDSNDTSTHVICGEVSSLSPFAVTELNEAPMMGEVIAPIDPVQANSTVNTTTSFTDTNKFDTHTASWDWGDGSTSPGMVTEANGSGAATGSHTYTSAGVYTVNVTVTDNNGGSGEATYQYIVVYDPGAGFVTGGGWITSPAGAYTADPTLTGKANFGFVAKYQHGATTPSGQTQFGFHASGLDFHSTDYEWLVVAGAKAKYKGSGTINGSGEYGFMLTAVDGQKSGGGGVDKFRIKIWDKNTGNIIYDNQMGAPDDEDATTAIQGGSIVIHK